MALILNIDTASTNCSLALSENGKMLACAERNEPNIHAASFHVFLDQLMKETGHKLQDLDAVCVSKGPGSYTGLRIGVSSAKGLCYGLGIPLLSLPTLLVMASHMRTVSPHRDNRPVLFCPALDARRMEIYTAFYDSSLEEIKPTSADVIDENSYAEYFSSYHLFFAGDGAEKCSRVFRHHAEASFMPGLYPSASFGCAMAYEKYRKQETEDLVSFEPYYLKDFVATVPRDHLAG